MNLTVEHYRALIIYDFRSNLTEQQCHDRLVAAFGEESAPTPSTIKTIYAELQGYTPANDSSELEEASSEDKPNTSKKKRTENDK